MRTVALGLLCGLALCGAFVTSPAGGTSTEGEIAFLRMTDGFWQVWLMEADGTGEKTLTQSDVDKVHLDWRPGTTELLYETGKGETFLLDSATGKQRQLLEGVGAKRAVWSPDGERLVYEVPLGDDLESRSVIRTSKPDGSERKPVTEGYFKRAPAP